MRVDEVRRRNRWRSFVVALFATLNYFAIVGFLWGVGVSILLTKFGYRPPVMVAVMAGLVLGAVTVVAYVSRRFRRLGPDLLRRFDAVTVDGVVHAELVNLMDGLAVATVVAPANTAVIDDPAPNALTVGTRSAETTIIVTTGLLHSLTRDELEAVLAVQFCEIARLDVMLRSVVSACTEGVIGLYRGARPDSMDPRKWTAALLLAPSMLIAKAIRSRTRRSLDHGADDMAVSIVRHPDALAKALRKLRADPQVVVSQNPDLASFWFERLPEPDGGKRGPTRENHAMEDRIQRLTSHRPA